nr:MAG TPA: Integrase [Caudoviricetes sp.]
MYKRKDGRYQEKLTINGKARYFYGHSKKEVLEKLRNYKEKQAAVYLFNNIADDWWDIKTEEIEHTTSRGYYHLYIRAKKDFENIPINEITIIQLNKSIADYGKTHTQKTVKGLISIYRMIYTYAINKGYININIAKELTLPHALQSKKREMPSQQDINTIKSSVTTQAGLLANMALYTGLRKGELLALTWEDIDLKNRLIHVTKSIYYVSNNPHLKLPKTKTSYGYVPILDKLLPVLKEKKKKGIIFNEEGKYLTSSQYHHMWEKYKRQTGIQCSIHQLRHAYATMLFESNISPEKMQILLRHAQFSTTMDMYRDIREEKQHQIFKEAYSADFK